MTEPLRQTAAIVLAAGKGTRIKAVDKNKVAYVLNGRPMIAHTVDNLHRAGILEVIAVVGFQADSVKEALGNSVTYAIQREQLGTGDALKTAIPALSPDIRTVLSVYGDDSAFYPPQLYRDLIKKQQSTQADILVLTIHKDDPTALGRIVRGPNGTIARIVEEKNATESEKKITEINTGFYCFARQFLTKYIDRIQPNPLSHEYLATDLVEIALAANKKVETFYLADSSIWHGVNTKEDYEQAKLKYRQTQT